MDNIEFEYKVVAYESVMSMLSDALSALDYKDRENVKNGEEYTNISIVAYDDIIEELMKNICVFTAVNEIDLIIDFINFDSIDYEDVYVASIVLEDGEMHFNVEKAMNEDGNYKELDFNKLYLDADSPEELITTVFMYESDVEYFLIDEDEIEE